MDSILLQIYRGSYDPHTRPEPNLDGYKEAAAEAREAWKEIEKIVGEEAAYERLYPAIAGESFYDQYHDFRQGFRLGALLMLELLDR